jgi:hypothetical protein
MIPHSFNIRPDKFAIEGEPRFRDVFAIDEIGGSYRGWFVYGFAAAVSVAGIHAIGVGAASDILR